MVAGRGNRHVILGTIEFLTLTSKTLQLPPRIPNRAPICQYFLPDSRKRLDSLETFVSKLSLLTPRRRSKIYFATLALLLRESARPSLRLLSALNIARQSLSLLLQPSTTAFYCGLLLDTNAGTVTAFLPCSLQERQDFPAHDRRQHEEIS